MSLILDNKKHKVGEILLDKISPGSKISVLSSYFTIYAFNKLKEQLKKVDSFRFLFLEPTFTDETDEKREFYIERIQREKQLGGGEFEIKMRNELIQSSIAKECADWIASKAQFKTIKKSNTTDAKAIHIHTDDQDYSIQGTVDFTASGLGFSPSKKMELNMLSDDQSTTKDTLQWFDEIRNNPQLSKEVTQDVLENIQCIYKENSPELLYFITLYNLFKSYLEEISEDNLIKTRTNFKETTVWNKLYKFQKDGVIGCIDKLERHGGCILADSVGLGKTFEALAVIKYYELRNYRVLVLAPKKLRDNWSLFRENDKRNSLASDRFAYDILNHTDLTRESGMSGNINLETINRGNYDLIVIDESHNFRNNDPRKDRITRYQKLMQDIIRSGVKTKVLMLSATPINNRMNDLKNQVAFITEGEDTHLNDIGINSISLTLKKAQQVFNQWMDESPDTRTLESLLTSFSIDYFKLLDSVTIARSRKHIEKYYNISDIGKFPERLTPKNIKSDIDLRGEFPSLEDINNSIKKLNLSVYAPLSYVRIDQRKKYEERYDISVNKGQSTLKQTDREKSLVNLMRVNILKRLESSVFSFHLTLQKIYSQVNNTLLAIQDFEQKKGDKSRDLDFTSIDEQIIENDEELESMIIGTKVKIDLADMDLLKRKSDLYNDIEYFEELLEHAKSVTPDRDAKLNDLKKDIINKMQNPINSNNKKIIIFTSFADTAGYLYDNIAGWIHNEQGIYSALLTGGGTNKVTHPRINTEFNSLLINFSPRSKQRDQVYPDIHDDIDILIATDCISEGQNLQDCDYLINYDIHWNPVRIIQRFGRIDRIGSINTKIQLVNFRPNVELDEYINLEARVRGRMILLDSSATGEDNIIETNASKEMNDLQYRKQQLQQIQNQVVDVEDISGGISITDLTMNDFKMELADYAKLHHKELETSPRGMYAITTSEEDIQPGIIYTLKQIQSSQVKSDEPNALHPYYMIYVGNDGSVYYSHLQAKRILDIYKKVCMGKPNALKELIVAFNKETKDATQMRHYSQLLEQSIKSIIGTKQEKEIESIFSLGVSGLAESSFVGLEDFELISFLVIQ